MSRAMRFLLAGAIGLAATLSAAAQTIPYLLAPQVPFSIGTASVLTLLGAGPSVFMVPSPNGGAGSAPPSSNCPEGTSFPDGCSGANPASVFQVAAAFAPGGHFNTAAATSTNYSATNIGSIGINAAGVHYPVGNFTPIASLIDPIANAPAGCTTTGTNPAGNPILACGNSFTANTISGFDFAARFGHPCVILDTREALPSSGILTITDNHFKNDGSCGFGPGNDYLVYANSHFNFEADVTYNLFEGNGVNFPYLNCGKAFFPGTPCNAVSAINTTGNAKFMYNSFVDFAGRVVFCNMTGTNPATSSLVFKYNYAEGWDYHPANGHTEFILCNSSNPSAIATEDYEYNTFVQTTAAMQFGPAPMFPASTAVVDIGSLKVNGNTVIGANVGGADHQTTVTACIGGTSACNTPGSNLFVSASTGVLGHGEEVGGVNGGGSCATSIAGTATVTNITAPVGGSSVITISGSTVGIAPAYSLTMNSGYGTNTMTVSSYGTGVGGAGTYNVSNTNTGAFSGSATAAIPIGENVTTWINANTGGGTGTGSSWTVDNNFVPSPFLIVGPATCSSVLMWSPSQLIGVMQATTFFHNIGSLTWQNNFVDSTSTFGGIWQFAGSVSNPTICGTPAVVLGNVDMAGISTQPFINPVLTGSSNTTGC